MDKRFPRAVPTAAQEPSPKRPGASDTSDATRQLLARAQGGHAGAFDELVRQHQRLVYYTALRYVKSDADAADVTQKVFVRAYRSLASFRGDSSLGTWLTRIAINLSLNHLRDHKRASMVDIADLADSGAGGALETQAMGAGRVIEEERSQALRRAVDSLPAKQRAVLELRVYQELSFREVADIVGSTENTAKVNFHHAVKKLRALLSQDAAHDQEDSP